MATRQEIQIAWDLVKFINIINDFLDISVPLIKGQTEEKRVDVIKTRVKRVCANIYGYRNKINTFLANPENKRMAINGLNAWGINFQEITDEYHYLLHETDYINKEIDTATNQQELNIFADHIDATVPKLPLVRRV